MKFPQDHTSVGAGEYLDCWKRGGDGRMICRTRQGRFSPQTLPPTPLPSTCPTQPLIIPLFVFRSHPAVLGGYTQVKGPWGSTRGWTRTYTHIHTAFTQPFDPSPQPCHIIRWEAVNYLPAGSCKFTESEEGIMWSLIYSQMIRGLGDSLKPIIVTWGWQRESVLRNEAYDFVGSDAISM